MDRFVLNGELDVNGTSTVIAYNQRVTSIDLLVFALFTIMFLCFLLVTFPGLVLHTVLAYILESRTITTFLIFGRAFNVLETIDFLDSVDDRSASREH
jgi:hypothetical protein